MDPSVLIPPQKPNPLMPPPIPGITGPLTPPPPSPSLGFQAWASDPQNAMKVTHSMTDPNQPLQPNAPQQMASATPPPTRTQLALTPPGGFPKPEAPTPQISDFAPQQKQLATDTAELQRLQKNGAGLNQIQNPFLRTLARVGDAAGTILAPGVASAIPGTTVHNWTLQNQQQGRVANDQAAIAAQQGQLKDQADLQHTQAETAAIPINTQIKRLQLDNGAASHGMKIVDDGQGNLSVVPDEDSPVYQRQIAQANFIDSGIKLRQAQADLAKFRSDPNNPQYKLAQQRIDQEAQRNKIAAQALGIRGEELAFQEDKAYNPQPNGTERQRADLGKSALLQIQTMRDIINRRGDLFGPAAGRGTNLQAWVGSSDPDAATFRSAQAYLAEHSTGMMGSRNGEVMKHNMDLQDPRFNTNALLASLDQAEKTSNEFVKAGTIHGKPASVANPLAPPKVGGGTQTFTDNGVTYNIPKAQVAEFKKDHPNAR